MHKQSVAFTLLVLTLLTACTDGDARLSPLEPGFTTESSIAGFQPSIGLGTSLLSSQRAGDARCPDDPPFVAPFTLTVGADKGFNVSLEAVRLRFADVVGVPMPQVTLTPPTLMRLFGSTEIPAHGSRAFPFLFRFGCGTSRAGRLIIIVDTRSRGRLASTELAVAIQ